MAALELEEESKYADSQINTPADEAEDTTFAPRALSTAAFPTQFESKFITLPRHKPQAYGKETVFEGQRDRRRPYYNTNIDFYSRVGQLRMKFNGLKTADGIDKGSVGTATVFYIDDESKRAYAITAAHNLIHYDPVDECFYTLKHAWFDRRRTSKGWIFTSSKSKKKYAVDQEWIHPDYDATQFVNEYDLGIVSFICDDGFYCGSNAKKSKFNNPGAHLEKLRVEDYLTNRKAKCASLSIIGYPGQKQGELHGEIVTARKVLYALAEKCDVKKDGKILSHTIHTSAGQSGSSVVASGISACVLGQKPCMFDFFSKILAIHTSTNSEDTNYGVRISEEIEQWIKNCVLSNGKQQNVEHILQLF